MTSKRAREERVYLANSLMSWKSLHSIDDDPYVEGLLQGLNSGENLEMWSSLNPLEYLPQLQGEPRSRIQRALFGATIIRNALVFSPVALTWLAISKATSAFAAYSATNSLTVVNFLDFWENGYGMLNHGWSLSHIAILDFQIVLLIIALTVGIGAFERKFKSERERELNQLDEDRTQMALEITAGLFGEQKLTPQVFNASTSGILRNLAATSKTMASTSKELTKSIKALPSHRELLTELKRIKSRSSRFEI
jgi:hypothetical protein